MSFVGFLGGAILGAKLPRRSAASSATASGRRSPASSWCSSARPSGSWSRRRWRRRAHPHPWRPAQTVDSVGGAVISGVSVLLVAWLMATAVNRSPYEALRRQVHGSAHHPGGRLAGARQRPAAVRELPAPGGAAGLPAGVRRPRRRHVVPPARPTRRSRTAPCHAGAPEHPEGQRRRPVVPEGHRGQRFRLSRPST